MIHRYSGHILFVKNAGERRWSRGGKFKVEKMMIKENVDLREIYEYMKKLSFPYNYDVSYDLWEKSYLYDRDGEGRILFRNLETLGAYEDGRLVGFIQYGKTTFGFDETGGEGIT